MLQTQVRSQQLNLPRQPTRFLPSTKCAHALVQARMSAYCYTSGGPLPASSPDWRLLYPDNYPLLLLLLLLLPAGSLLVVFVRACRL